jgi:5,10-methenyltetrahydromethanopterin hydrogenase
MENVLSPESKDTESQFTVLDAEDEIITLFCTKNGGMEFAMPIIRKQFNDIGMDFKKPTKDELIILANRLVEITRALHGDFVARNELQEFLHIINRVPD